MNEIVLNIDKLREIALDQHGYVTTTQANDAGVAKPALAMLVKRGRLERAAFGVYRVPQVPATQYDPFTLAVLWTGVAEAVLSHETALAAYEVSDVNPTTINITVAERRRIRRSGGTGYAIHYQDLEPDQITWWQQIPIVTLKTAIEQCLQSGTPSYLLRQAIENGGRVGLLLADDVARLTKNLEDRNG